MSDPVPPAGPAGPGRAFVTLRPVEDGDVELLRALFMTARPELAMLPLPPRAAAQLVELQWQAQRTGHRAAHPHAADLVIECDRRPVGRLLVDDGPPVTVVDLVVLPENRGRGVGSAVLEAVVAGADRRGVPAQLHVRVDNPARRLYERLGFVAQAGAAGLVDVRMVRQPGAG